MVRLGIIARKPAKKWGDSYLIFGSRMPLTVEPLKEEDIPTMIGCNEGEWMSKALKGDLDD